MDFNYLPIGLKMKQEPVEEHLENSSIFDVKVEEGIEFCAVQNIKEEYILENKVKLEIVEFNYNQVSGCNDETSVTCSLGLTGYNEASSCQIKKYENGDNDDNKSLPIECILQRNNQMGNTEENSSFIDVDKKNENDKSFICKTCGKMFPDQKLLCAHVQIHKDNASKCHICDKHLCDSRSLKEHLKRHVGVKNYQCNICFKDFVYSSDFKRHLLVHQDKKYQCDICGSKFKRKSGVTSHIKQLHIISKEFQCEICKRQFGRRVDVKRHMVTHGDFTKHQCHVCKKYFRNVHDLKRHFVTHSKVKSFKCNLCDMLYAHKSSLVIHTKVHEDILYKCDTCKNSFSCKPYLLKHFNRHKYL